jgi:hypothetical protein
MLNGLLFCLLMVFAFSPAAFAKDDCLSCHGQKGAPGFVNNAMFKESVHAKLSCDNCHAGIKGYPHNKKTVEVNCGNCHFAGLKGAPKEQAHDYALSVHGKAQAFGHTDSANKLFWKSGITAPKCQTCHGSHYIFRPNDSRSATRRENIPALCARCHSEEFKEYRASIHGKKFFGNGNKNAGAPTCFDCHEEHLIPNTKDAHWMLDLVRVCGNCHNEQIKEYRKTYHGKVTQLGFTTVAKCSDCHGHHSIQPIHDPLSTLSEQNILTTCRKCHPTATQGFTKFYAHPDEKNREKYPLIYYPLLFMTVLLIAVFTFFLTHSVLWLYRGLKERKKKNAGE